MVVCFIVLRDTGHGKKKTCTVYYHSTVPACVRLETSVRGHHGLDEIQ